MRSRGLLAALGVGTLAVICCARLRALLALLGGVGVVGLPGGGVSLAALGASAGAFVAWARRRRACALPPARARMGA
jgi:hypothetical protein